MKSREEFVRTEKLLRSESKKIIAVLAVALLFSIACFAAQVYFYYEYATPLAIPFIVLFSLLTFVSAFLLWPEIRELRDDPDSP